jgi:hypothetical protein
MPTHLKNDRSRGLLLSLVCLGMLALSGSVLAANKRCFEVQLEWAVPGHIPMNDAPFVVYDHKKTVLYRGRADKDGVAHICVARLPADATIDSYPDEPGGSPPSRIFPSEKQQ